LGRAQENGHRQEGETGMRGFLGGVSVGALVAVAGAAVWSLSTPLPQAVDVSHETPTTTLEPRETPTQSLDTPGSDADVVETAPAEPTAEGTISDDAPSEIDTTAPERPAVSTETEAALDSAPEGVDAPEISVASDDPLPGTDAGDSTQPAAPLVEESPAVVNDPAAAPEVADSGEPALTAPEEETPAPELSQEAEDTPAPVRLDSAAVEAPGIGTPPDATPSPNLTTPPVRSDETGEDDSGELRIADLPQTAGDEGTEPGPSIGTRVVPLTERNKAAPATGAEATPETPPFIRNAEPASPEPGVPLMSIILIEEEGAVGAEALEDFPYPLTFAIDPSDPDAVARMNARRSAGFEVMVLADLPREGQPQDAETAMPVWFDRVPEAVGILEGIDSGVQGNRPLADQVATIAADLGYGLVLQDNGLNTVQKMALRDGIPSGVVFRDFDGAGQDPRAMRRFLDQAAFRSGQEGAVIMLGRLKPDTISALLIWGLQDRASRVELVPISTSLKRLLEPNAQ